MAGRGIRDELGQKRAPPSEKPLKGALKTSSSITLQNTFRNIPDEHYWKFKALCALEKRQPNVSKK